MKVDARKKTAKEGRVNAGEADEEEGKRGEREGQRDHSGRVLECVRGAALHVRVVPSGVWSVLWCRGRSQRLSHLPKHMWPIKLPSPISQCKHILAHDFHLPLPDFCSRFFSVKNTMSFPCGRRLICILIGYTSMVIPVASTSHN